MAFLGALARSFVHTPHARRITTGPGRPRAPVPAPTYFAPPPGRRNFELAPSTPADRPPHPAPAPGLARRPINRQIPFSHVYVLDADTNKVSSARYSLEALLETQRRERGVVELLASFPKPIVRMTTRSEAEARYKALKRALRNGAVGEIPKEVQLTWGVAWADVEHKLRKAKRDLDKGYRVVVTITIKRGHRPSSQRELVAFADKIAAELGGVGEEHKERETTGRSMVLSFRKADVP